MALSDRIGSKAVDVNQATGKVYNITYIGRITEYQMNTDISVLTVTQLGGRDPHTKDSSISLHCGKQDCVVIPSEAKS